MEIHSSHPFFSIIHHPKYILSIQVPFYVRDNCVRPTLLLVRHVWTGSEDFGSARFGSVLVLAEIEVRCSRRIGALGSGMRRHARDRSNHVRCAAVVAGGCVKTLSSVGGYGRVISLQPALATGRSPYTHVFGRHVCTYVQPIVRHNKTHFWKGV